MAYAGDMVGYEYENRGNKKLCVVKDVVNNLVTFNKLPDRKTCYQLDYSNFKRAWVKRGVHLPNVGSIYKRRDDAPPIHFADYVFVTSIYETNDTYSTYTHTVNYENMNQTKGLTATRLGPQQFYRVYEFHQ